MINIADMITRNAIESMSIRYANEQTDYIADDVFHPLIVSKESVKLWQYDTSNFRLRATESSTKAAANKLDFSGFYVNKDLTLHKEGGDIDPNDEANADAVVSDIREEIAMGIMDSLLIRKEYLAATAATTAGNYPSDLKVTLAAADCWDQVGGDPVNVVKTAKLAIRLRTGKVANAMAISYTGFLALQESPVLKDRLKYTSGQSITSEQLKNLLGLQHLFVGKALANTNVEGNSTQTLSELWNDSAVVYVHDPAPRRKKVCFGVQPLFNSLYSYEAIDTKRGGPKGRIQEMEMGWSYNLSAGAVISSSDSDFAAGYLVSNIF